MKFVLVVFVYIILREVKSEEGHSHEDEAAGREHVIDEITDHLETGTKSSDNHTVFKFKDITKLFAELNFKNCTNTSLYSSCNLCLTSRDLINWYNYNENITLSEESFRELLLGILYFLIPHDEAISKSDANADYDGVVCKTFKIKIKANETSSLFEVYSKKYGADSGKLNEESLDKILEDVNKTIGHRLTNEKCFSAHDVLVGVNITETSIDEHDFEYASAFIILKLLNKNCIADENHNNLSPKQTFFADQIFSEFGNDTHMTHENFEALVKKLELGTVKATTVSSDDDHDDHDHRKKRSIGDRKRRSITTGFSKQCFSGEELLAIFSVAEGSTIDKAKFENICPALIQQLESGNCNVTSNANSTSSDEHKDDDWKAWIAGLVATLVITIGSLAGLLAVPFAKEKWFPYLIMYLIALAVSVLAGDALLHLLPHSLGLHVHEEGDGHNHSGNEALKSDSFVWKSMMFLVGVYAFFLFEIFMHAFSGHSHSHGPDGMTSLEDSHKHAGRVNSLSKQSVNDTLQMSEDAVFVNRNRTESTIMTTPAGMHACADEKEFNMKAVYKNGHNNGSIDFKKNTIKSPNTSKNMMSIKNFKSIVWMVLIGDAIHNFLDGIAVGVAFTEEWPSGLHGGISTSIAIFCHELPHELGDFAILLSSGLTIKQALVMNFISSLSAFVGAIVGLILGTTWDAMPWLFACTAGLFVYIALVDMLPEILHSKLLKVRPWTCISLQVMGLLTGWLIMFCLAAWEEDIKTAFKA